MQYCSRELSDSSQTCRGSGHALLTSSCTLLYCTNKEKSSFSWNLTCIGAAFSFPKFLVMFTGPGCWSYLKHPYNGFSEQMASLNICCGHFSKLRIPMFFRFQPAGGEEQATVHHPGHHHLSLQRLRLCPNLLHDLLSKVTKAIDKNAIYNVF